MIRVDNHGLEGWIEVAYVFKLGTEVAAENEGLVIIAE